MKNLANILRRADIEPRDRIVALVQNRIRKEKDSKGILSESEIHSLTDGWKPKSTQEAREYNKYLELSKLEMSMRIDAQMFLYRSENLLLRSHVLLEGLKNKVGRTGDSVTDKYIPSEDALNFAIQNTHLDHATLIHTLTFNNLPKEIQDELLLLDEYVAHDKKYLEDEVFLYELFKDTKTLSIQNKYTLIDRIFSCIYHEGFKKIKNDSEKDGFLPHHFFAELPMDGVFKKWAEYNQINIDGKDNNYVLDKLEEYAKGKGKTMEMVIKETLSRWIDDGLFVSEYTPMFFSDNRNTWNGDTKLTHKEIFSRWHEELQRTKISIEKIITEGDLLVEWLDKEILGVSERVKIITGRSLYESKADIDFIAEYKEQIPILLPLSGVYLFIKKYNKPLENIATLKSFAELSKTFSYSFDIDMTDKYSEFVTSLEQEVKLLNHSISMALDSVSGFICGMDNRKYPIGINENNFMFNAKNDLNRPVDTVIDNYRQTLQKTGF
jgi:hypothetical protein